MTRMLIALALAMPVALIAQEGGAPAAGAEKPKAKIAAGEVVKVEADSITIKGKKDEQTIKIAADCKVMIEGKEAKAEDLKAGTKVSISLAEDGSAAKITVAPAKKEKKEGAAH